MKTLLAGCDSIEFGWNVCTWIPYLRRKAQKFEHVVIVCKPENEYLYRDFADDFEYYTAKGTPDMWYRDRFPTKKAKIPKNIISKHPGAKIVIPNKDACLNGSRLFFKYGTYEPKLRYDLVIHARAEAKWGRQDRNWDVYKYVKLLKDLRNEKYISACSVGTKEGAYHVPGTEDLRGVELESLCNVMTSSKLTIGVSSGPMHLAHLCKCPILVWTYDKKEKAISANNKKRYTKLWRAWETPVKVFDESGWKPPVNSIATRIRDFI